MSLAFPIELKYYTVSVGTSTAMHKDDMTMEVYVVINNVSGVQEFEGLNFPDVYETALGLDRNFSLAELYSAKNDGFKHLQLDDAVEEVSSLIVPSGELIN